MLLYFLFCWGFLFLTFFLLLEFKKKILFFSLEKLHGFKNNIFPQTSTGLSQTHRMANFTPTPTPTHTHLLGFHRLQSLLRTSLTTAFPSPAYCPWYKCTFDVTHYSRLLAVFPGIPFEDDRNWTAWLISEGFLTNYKDSIYTVYQRQPQQNAPHSCRLATSNFLCISISPPEMFSLLLLWPWC